jgi:hypothetical protein
MKKKKKEKKVGGRERESPLICNGTIRNPWTHSGVEVRSCGNATVRSGSSLILFHCDACKKAQF